MSKEISIVIVDDEQIVTSSLKTFLMFEGIEDVEFFNDPQEALEFLKITKPDVVLSDFLMPKMNGIEFLSKVKEMYPFLSTILLTGYADKENAIKAINEVGIYRYLEKPWDNEDLLINIKNGIERSKLYDSLNDKISELEVANSKLEEYSSSLEKLVEKKTASLQKSYSKLSAIFENCADGIIIIDSDGLVKQANSACENLFGMGESMLSQKNFSQLCVCHSENNILEKLKEDENVFLRNCEIYNTIKEKNIPIEVSFAPVDTEKTEYVGVIRDVTLQQEMDRLRDDFIATLTHDLRTPLLASIQSLGFFLDGVMGDISDKQKTMLDAMKRSSEDMLGLVNALLEVYKYESGKLNICKTHFDINNLIVECYENIKSLVLSKNLEFNLNIDATKDVLLMADRNEIRRVIVNLCGNAVKFTESGQKIEITTKIDGNDFQFSVKDDGIGIPKNDIPKMFKRFSQGTSDKRSTGTGLGLYLSRQIIDAHNGKIWVVSEKNEGSEFSFLLPQSVSLKVGV